MINDYLTFNYKQGLGLINIRIKKYEGNRDKISCLSNWLGKEPTTLLLLHLLRRINSSFTNETNGWKYQDSELVKEVNSEMKKLLENNWTGIEKTEEVTVPLINE